MLGLVGLGRAKRGAFEPRAGTGSWPVLASNQRVKFSGHLSDVRRDKAAPPKSGQVKLVLSTVNVEADIRANIRILKIVSWRWRSPRPARGSWPGSLRSGRSSFPRAWSSRRPTIRSGATSTRRRTPRSTASGAPRQPCETISLGGCEMYSTCEPCPMCLSAIHWSKIDRVVFGATIADAAAAGFCELHIDAAELAQMRGQPAQGGKRSSARGMRALFRVFGVTLHFAELTDCARKFAACVAALSQYYLTCFCTRSHA